MTQGVAEILSSLRCDRAANDRRRHPRVGLRARVAFETLDPHHRPGDARLAWMRDVSEGGAGLHVREQLEAGQEILLHIPLDGGRATPVRCRVVHCAKAGGGWRVGVEFQTRPWRDDKATVVLNKGQATWSTDSGGGLGGETRRLRDAVTGYA